MAIDLDMVVKPAPFSTRRIGIGSGFSAGLSTARFFYNLVISGRAVH